MKPNVEVMRCESGTEEELGNPNTAASLKFDGTRIWAGNVEGKGFIINRMNVDYTDRLPELVEVIETLPENVILDGEAVWYNEAGRSIFEGSQRRCATQDMNKQRQYRIQYPLVIETWDIVELDGKDLRNMTWQSRDYLLSELLKESVQIRGGVRIPNVVRYVPNYFGEDQQTLFDKAVEMGEEGVIVKDVNSPYVGKRSRSWRKVKKFYHERVKVVGFTEGSGTRDNLWGSLILARPDDQGILRYCGKVGSGFDMAEVRNISKILNAGELDNIEVDARDSTDKQIPYTPVNVPTEITVRFQESTKNGVFRMPSVSKDKQGNNLIHYNDPTIKATPKAMSLKDMLEGMSR